MVAEIKEKVYVEELRKPSVPIEGERESELI